MKRRNGVDWLEMAWGVTLAMIVILMAVMVVDAGWHHFTGEAHNVTQCDT